MTPRLVIDNERCTGNGRCYELFPQLFTDDDRGYGAVAGDGLVREGAEDEAHRAVLACPEQAISLEGM